MASNNTDMSQKLANWLLSFLTAAFLAWSVAIWNAVEGLRELRSEIAALRASSTQTEKLVERHLGQPWHTEAGKQINRLLGGRARQ